MKILIITPDIYPYTRGYGGRIKLMLYNSFKKLGHEVDIISSIPDNIAPDLTMKQYSIQLIQLYHINKSTYSYFMPMHIKDFLSLRKYFRENIKNYDLILINDFTWSLILASLILLKNKNKNKIMMINHGILYSRVNKLTFSASKTFNKVIANTFLRNIRCIISFSKKTEMELQEIIKFNIRKKIIPFCLEPKSIIKTYENSLSVFNNILDKYKNSFNIDNFIFSISEINYHKGYHILLEACGSLLIQGYNFDIVIAGKKNEDYMYNLNKIISKYNIEKQVYFIGEIDDVEKFVLMMKSKVYIIPSLSEGFGVGAQEASILHIKTIATDTGAHRELLGNKEYNTIVKPGDVNELSAAIVKSLSSERILSKLDYETLYGYSCDRISKEILNFFNS